MTSCFPERTPRFGAYSGYRLIARGCLRGDRGSCSQLLCLRLLLVERGDRVAAEAPVQKGQVVREYVEIARQTLQALAFVNGVRSPQGVGLSL